ncbi:hypothetical protein HWV62_24846 [Athelia sp. TMB]|nr:hypothetical protein HWV62_24846 [Athelia sp. TMB]
MAKLVASGSSDYFEPEDPAWIEALNAAVLPGDLSPREPVPLSIKNSQEENIGTKRKLSSSEGPPDYVVVGEGGNDVDTYGASKFGDFGNYMRRKRAKLQIQNLEIPDGEGGEQTNSTIFQGLAIYIDGWTEPSVQDLRALIMKHGGVYHAYLDKKTLVTHIITCSLTPAKIKDFKHMKVVRPEWLTRSASLGTLLPWSDFIFRSEDRAGAIQGTKAAQKSLFNNFITASSSPKRMAPSSHDTDPSLRSSSEGGKPERNAVQNDQDFEPTPPTPPPAQPRPHLSSSQKTESASHNFATDDPSRPDLANPIADLKAPARPAYAAHDSNPHARRAMADPTWRAAHTSAAPDYVENYYQHSRLHHLSTWKAELRSLVAEALVRAESAAVGDGDDSGDGEQDLPRGAPAGVSMRGAELVVRSPGKQRAGSASMHFRTVDTHAKVIMHVDFDAFFVTAGLVSRPQLRGKPVVVCHSQGSQGSDASTSEIASASYEAREFGVKNGMRYKEFSLKFYTILMTHADELEAVSVDEALLDVTSSTAQFAAAHPDATDPAKEFADAIRTEVKEATGCELSIGIAANILLARLATRRAKPAGTYHLTPSGVPAFMATLQINDIWGFGYAAAKKADEKLGTRTLGDLVGKSRAVLCDALGKGAGEKLFNAIRGIDHQKLQSAKPRKSVSSEINQTRASSQYGIRFENNAQAEEFIARMAKEVANRLAEVSMSGRHLTLKIMKRAADAPIEAPKFMGHGSCDTFSRQTALVGPGGRATCDETIIADHAWRLLKSFNFDPKELRGIGIQIQKLESPLAASTPGAKADTGQGLLPFKALDRSSKHPLLPNIQLVVQPPSDDLVYGLPNNEPVAGPSRPQPVQADELPSFSQVDQEVFGALPDDVRQEIEAEYKRRSTTRSPAPVSFLQQRRSEPRDLFPKISVRGTNLKRITQQLAPKNRSIVSPKKHNIFRRSGVKITDEELIALDIDPEVFALIPEEMHREQLALAREAKRVGGIAAVVRDAQKHKRREIKASQRRSTSALYRRRPAPVARFPELVSLKRPGPQKEKAYFTEADDIQDVIQTWVDAFQQHPPHDKDVQLFSKFIVNNADGERSTDAGMEKSVAVLKWWLMLLRRRWSEWEKVDDEPIGEMGQREKVGRAWWKSFNLVKEQVDLMARKKFGGSVSMK